MFKFDFLPNEKMIVAYRQTESVLFKTMLLVFVLVYFPWYFLLKYELFTTYDKILFAWTILVFLYAANKYVLWLLNVYLLTDKRLIMVKYKTLFSKHVWETPLSNVLSVSFSVNGFWESMFQYGVVEVRARGLHEPLYLKNISHPSKVKDFIWKVLSSQNKPNNSA